jgi:hypothetical protein
MCALSSRSCCRSSRFARISRSSWLRSRAARCDHADALARDITALAGDIAKESGDLISTAIEAASDGKISINDARAIDNEAADLQDKIVSIRSATRKTIASKL